nr:MAG TPA: hypothetical protein [Caudoviricetes sp.]
MIKIMYKGAYDDGESEHYVIAADKGDYYEISKSQWLRCLRNRKVTGSAGIKFETEKPVLVAGQR